MKNYDLDRIFASGSERSKRTLWVNPQGFNQNRVKNRNKIIQISPNNFEELVRISNILETYGLVKCFSQTIIYSCHMLEISSSASFVKFLRKYERLNIELVFIDESERPLNFFSRLVREYVT